ncbi:hypothetical protein NHG34_08035 [Aerococcaceae bacterium NML190938]|nr:hypothetical protein [Aerococcaceae bacterium NML191219]MCW6667506.1 hypothetical protein [Aerococcaceae bacterium NML190938]
MISKKEAEKLKKTYNYLEQLLMECGYNLNDGDSEKQRVYNLVYSEICSLGVAIARGDGQKLYTYYKEKLQKDIEKISRNIVENEPNKEATTSQDEIQNNDDSKKVNQNSKDTDAQQKQNDNAKLVRSKLLTNIFNQTSIKLTEEIDSKQIFSFSDKQKALDYVIFLKRTILCFDNGEKKERLNIDGNGE